jgi:hypothetical protein
VKERLRNRPAKKVDYDESRDEGDDDEEQVVVKKRGRKKMKVVQNHTSSAEKVDGDKKLRGRPRKKTNVANTKEKVQNKDIVKINKWTQKVISLLFPVTSTCGSVSDFWIFNSGLKRSP